MSGKEEVNENFKVVIRVRPPAQRELDTDKQFYSIVKIPPDEDKTITILEHLDTDDGRGGVYSSQVFTFDRVYDQSAQQADVYENTARPAVEAVLSGYNATMIAYGQTGTGKTYTMEGVGNEKGIIPRATEEIFNYIKSCPENRRFRVRASYMQIYNEVISDLLRPGNNQGLSIREGKDKGVYVRQLSLWPVRSPQEICSLMERGGRERVTANMRMSELSSRSHAIFRIVVHETTMEGSGENEQISKVKGGQLNLVDLAGSEKIRQTGATGQRLEESKYINKSLSHLGNVIAALTSKDGNARQYVPYRDSKLTRILEDSLGGNCKTTMIATISPAPDSYTESLSTLKYANRAKNIKNDAVVNEDVGQKGLIKKYEKELERLREQLSTMVEERKLQGESIPPSVLNSGYAGDKSNDPDFRDAIHKVSAEYMTRLDELDKERQVIEEDKAQVDRYKQLLLKQRDIMIGLTARLNERDESILSLQEELDAYDHQQKLMEEALDQRTEAMLRASVCSSCKSAAQQVSGSLQGEMSNISHQVSQLKREIINGKPRWLAEGAPYDPSEEYYITSEEKVHELHQLLNQLKQEIALQPPNIRDRLLEAQEEKAAMEYILKERIGTMVQNTIAEHVAAHKREIDVWKSKHQLIEEHLRNAEYKLQLSTLEGGVQNSESHARLQEILNKEVASIKMPYDEKLSAMKREVDTKEAERRHAVKEAERLQFELFSTRRRYNIPDGGNQENEYHRVWNKVKQAELDARHHDDSGTGRLPFDDLSNVQSGAAKQATDDTRVKHLEWKLKQQSVELEEAQNAVKNLSQQQQQQQHGHPSSAARDRELLSLQRRLATLTKDREALKTIMESKMKSKVDNISNLLNSCYLPTADADSRSRLNNEVRQLQSLVNRSIQAI